MFIGPWTNDLVYSTGCGGNSIESKKEIPAFFNLFSQEDDFIHHTEMFWKLPFLRIILPTQKSIV